MARKTLDELLGVRGLSISAAVGSGLVLGGILGGTLGGAILPISYIAGMVAIYLLIKRRKDPEIQEYKKISWIFIVV